MAGNGRFFGWGLLALGVAWAAWDTKRNQERNARSNESARHSRETRMAESRAKRTLDQAAWDEHMRPFRERVALGDRVRRVEELFKRRPDLSQQWNEHLIDKFEPERGSGPFQLVNGKSTGFRGPRNDVITDLTTGDRLEILAGDVADNWFDGAVRVGRTGQQKRFEFSVGQNVVKLRRPLDDESTLALARLFNAETGNWQFSRLGKPVTIIRPKAEFHGRENLERLMLAKAEFGERYLD